MQWGLLQLFTHHIALVVVDRDTADLVFQSLGVSVAEHSDPVYKNPVAAMVDMIQAALSAAEVILDDRAVLPVLGWPLVGLVAGTVGSEDSRRVVLLHKSLGTDR